MPTNARRKNKRSNRKFSKKMVSVNSKVFKKAVRKEATAVITQSKTTLIMRQFWLGEYDFGDDRWQNMQYVDRLGRILRLHCIPKTDLNQPVNLAMAADPFSVAARDENGNLVRHQDDPGGDVDGATQGMSIVELHGRRSNETIKVKGFSIDGFISHPGYSALNFPIDYSRHIVNWALVTATLDDASLGASLLYKPAFNELIRLPYTGFSPLLDLEYVNDSSKLPHRRLASGSVSIPISEMVSSPKQRKFSKYVKFNKPLTITWDPADQTGQKVLQTPLYLCIWSNQLSTEGVNRVRFGCVTRIYYYND